MSSVGERTQSFLSQFPSRDRSESRDERASGTPGAQRRQPEREERGSNERAGDRPNERARGYYDQRQERGPNERAGDRPNERAYGR